MPCIVADRFLAIDERWIDLATGDPVRLRIGAAGPPRAQFEWAARCEVLANLRHPLLAPLVDYGTADREHVFEAYSALGPVHTTPTAAATLLAHAIRFLEAYGVDLPRPLADYVLRPVTAGTIRSVAPVGVFLQPRAVFETIADSLEAQGPGGTCAITIAGPPGSGLRTLRLATARAARLQGYAPVSPGALRRLPWIADRLLNRHMCVIGEDEPPHLLAVTVGLIARLATASARRHHVLSFTRSHRAQGGCVVHIDSMGVRAMTGMVFVDRELGPSTDEIVSAVRRSDGRPGQCLAHLGVRDYAFTRSPAMVVHESVPTYGSEGGLVARGTERQRDPRRSGGAVLRSLARAEQLARRGRHAAADRVLSRASRVLEGRGNVDMAARVHVVRGWLARDRARGTSAATHFERARDLARSPTIALNATVGLGVAMTDDGQLDAAEAALRSALSGAEHIGDGEVLATAACALARCFVWRGQPDEALAILRRVPETATPDIRSRALSLRARAHVGEGAIAAAVREARSAVESAEAASDSRAITAAYQALAIAVAAAGDRESAQRHLAAALRVATAAHLSLMVFRLRVTAAAAGLSSRPAASLERIASHAAAWPRLLHFAARAALARLTGSELDAATRSFVAASGARALERPPHAAITNPMADLEALLDLTHSAPDERAAVERVAAEVHGRLKTATVIVVSGCPERRTLAIAGRAWHGDPHIAWRAVGAGLGVPVDTTFEPPQAAEPVRYGGQVIGALAVRWTAGAIVDPDAVSALLRVAGLAIASSIRTVLDRGVPIVCSGPCEDLVGDSAPVQSLREAITRASRAPFPILIQGESGSGKELVARAIHRLGPRRERRFCALNCAALSDELIEAELFGHARGAFTGAVGERPGMFEEADGGTLFLDEIGELSARAQAKLLRVLQDGEVRRVGENVARRVDVRILAATNRRLEEEVTAGRFRADLRFRLDVVRIEVPPLRERAGDVPMLATRFWNDAAARVGSRATLAPEAVAALARYDWPGNVRELQNVIAWIAVHSPRRGRIGSGALPQHVAHGGVLPARSLEAAKEEFERRFVKAALASAGGHRVRAARALGVTRQGLAKMLRRLRIE
jgi:transcriptional regulator with AAA-type ATPase domain/tetratricopeptide (TPR) repeat protein